MGVKRAGREQIWLFYWYFIFISYWFITLSTSNVVMDDSFRIVTIKIDELVTSFDMQCML